MMVDGGCKVLKLGTMDRDETSLASSEAAPRMYSGKKTLLRFVERGDRAAREQLSSYGDHPRGRKTAPSTVRSDAGSPLSRNWAPAGMAERDNQAPTIDTRAPVPTPGIVAALLSLASLALDTGPDVAAAVSAILTLLADNLDAGAIVLTRLEGETLCTEHSLDRAGMGVTSGAVAPLRDTY